MAISFKKYVDITSGVGGNSPVAQREFIGRIFSINPLIPTKTVIEFTTLEDVGTYFGTGSEEYARASFYFGFIGKNITRPNKISFARWTDADVAPRIYGAKGIQALASWTSITAGSFTLTIGGVSNTMSAMNFSAAADLAGVAAIIQTAIRTKTGTQWTAATVTYDATNQRFNFVGGSAVAATISVTAGTLGVDIAGQLGWLSPSAILSAGALLETIIQTLTLSADETDNFGSFLFQKALTSAERLAATIWNDAQNVKYIFCLATLAVDASANSAALLTYSGTGITLLGVSNEYPEMAPMILLASIDFTNRDSVINFMFQQFSLTPSVTTTTESNSYDALRVNYYGRTQTAGQLIDFYQAGYLTGGATDPVDMNVYANEMWLKDAAGARIMQLLLSLGRVSANANGTAQLLAVVQSVIDMALFNGTISPNKDLDITQQLYITQITGDKLAWRQVASKGYWIACVVQKYVENGVTKFKAKYTLVYSKDDAIRKVEGTHVLI